jgi:hypothetical protein
MWISTINYTEQVLGHVEVLQHKDGRVLLVLPVECAGIVQQPTANSQ